MADRRESDDAAGLTIIWDGPQWEAPIQNRRHEGAGNDPREGMSREPADRSAQLRDIEELVAKLATVSRQLGFAARNARSTRPSDLRIGQIVFDRPRLAVQEIAQLLAEIQERVPAIAVWLKTDVMGSSVRLGASQEQEEVIELIRGLLGDNPALVGERADDPAAACTATLIARLYYPSDVSEAATLPISIYLADEAIHEDVETAVEDLLAVAGLRIEARDEPIIGSWFRSMRAGIKQFAHSAAGRETALTVAHVVDSRLILAQDAQVTAMLLQNLGGVISSLQQTKDAVLRVGALLIVKADWTVQVFQLTPAQQAVLDHRPQLARSPHEIIAALQLVGEDQCPMPPAMER